MCPLSTQDQAGKSPSIAYGFEIDPSAILGVTNNASLQEIRDAYRLKARKHHPDQGGDEWAFRIVARSYEILSTARVAGRVVQEAQKSSGPERPAPFRKMAPGDAGWLRPGRRDPWIEPPRLVDVEILSLRFEMADPTDLLLKPVSERSLSCCLSLSWTSPPPGPWGEHHPDAHLAQKLLTDTFAALPARTHATSSWSRCEGEKKFEGWLSYPTATRAHEAFRILHEDLNGCGLGVNQWTRDLIIPRGGR
ncbi:J domain-containing protein [Singulisphaera sp. Ch08]|uniref:J domain-containing protein n=1 Tax=Singulisphaera sp. Ch08 TaxID=3120278 RepID=A0AAU7CAU2_9BACT